MMDEIAGNKCGIIITVDAEHEVPSTRPHARPADPAVVYSQSARSRRGTSETPRCGLQLANRKRAPTAPVIFELKGFAPEGELKGSG
jgi:hypothetical protein